MSARFTKAEEARMAGNLRRADQLLDMLFGYRQDAVHRNRDIVNVARALEDAGNRERRRREARPLPRKRRRAKR